MSLRAMTWVLYEVGPERADVYTKLLLLVIADQADDDGRNAIVSKRYLSEATGFGETTVTDRLRRAERDGLIRPGDPRTVEYIPANRRPGVWDLRMGAYQLAPRARGNGRHSRAGDVAGIAEVRRAIRDQKDGAR